MHDSTLGGPIAFVHGVDAFLPQGVGGRKGYRVPPDAVAADPFGNAGGAGWFGGHLLAMPIPVQSPIPILEEVYPRGDSHGGKDKERS